MAFKFANYARFVASRKVGGENIDWHQWMVFMDEPPDRCDLVRSVEYRLHDTFPNPIRVVTDRSSRFALSSAGWGEFRIFITVHLKDGGVERTHHDLDLSREPPVGMRLPRVQVP